MRMRGLEPPRSHLHTDLNRARLPIPPHPRVSELPNIAHRRGARIQRSGGGRPVAWLPAEKALCPAPARFASLGRVDCAPLSSRGLGRRPLMAETRVRIPVAVLLAPRVDGAFRVPGAMMARLMARLDDESGEAYPARRARRHVRC